MTASRSDRSDRRKEKKRKKKEKSSKKRSREDSDAQGGKSKKQRLLKKEKEESIAKPVSKEQREKLKKLPARKKHYVPNEAVKKVRQLTKAKARNLHSRPAFMSSDKRTKFKRNLDAEARTKEKKRLDKIKKVRTEFRKQYEMEDVRESRSSRYDREERRVKKYGEEKTLKFEETNEKEMQLIKESYLGKKKKKKTVLPPSAKFKFNFDWDADEDTSENYNSLYKKRHKITLRCGRSVFGGYDPDIQKKKSKEKWSRLVHRKPMLNTSQKGGLYEILRQKREARKLRTSENKKKAAQDYRHWRKKKLSEMTPRDWRIFKEDFRISTKFGGKLPTPIRFWDEAGLPVEIMNAIREARYRKPYPIQRMAIPVGMANRDCVGVAETGSGKTAAFVIPMLIYVSRQPPMTHELAGDGPYALIMAPTRELAMQIEGETKKFAVEMKLKTMTIVGGVDIHMQSALATNGVEIIIATPGRLLDSLQKRFLALNQCKYIVLDEADRMIDMGFKDDVESIMAYMPASNLRPTDENQIVEENKIFRQTFMFSATFGTEVERLSRQYLRSPVFITIGDPNERGAANVTQHVVWTTDSSKRKELQRLLDSRKIEIPAMIFMNTKKACETLARHLRDQNCSAEAMHGGKIQEQRVATMKKFQDRKIDYLVCTDVAGRGIDVKGVKTVVNYDMTTTIEYYLHRIGRTGRAESKGTSYTLVTEDDADVFYDLRQILMNGQFSLPRELDRHPRAQRKGPGKDRKSKTVFKA